MFTLLINLLFPHKISLHGPGGRRNYSANQGPKWGGRLWNLVGFCSKHRLSEISPSVDAQNDRLTLSTWLILMYAVCI